MFKLHLLRSFGRGLMFLECGVKYFPTWLQPSNVGSNLPIDFNLSILFLILRDRYFTMFKRINLSTFNESLFEL